MSCGEGFFPYQVMLQLLETFGGITPPASSKPSFHKLILDICIPQGSTILAGIQSGILIFILYYYIIYFFILL